MMSMFCSMVMLCLVNMVEMGVCSFLLVVLVLWKIWFLCRFSCMYSFMVISMIESRKGMC